MKLRKGVIILFVAVVALLTFLSDKEAFSSEVKREVFVTDGPVTSISKTNVELHGIMVIGFDKDTRLYNMKGRQIPIDGLKKGDFVTVIFIEKGEELLAKEIYINPEEGVIQLSSAGKNYFKKAGIAIPERPKEFKFPMKKGERLKRGEEPTK